jgi:hypothetical protein
VLPQVLLRRLGLLLRLLLLPPLLRPAAAGWPDQRKLLHCPAACLRTQWQHTINISINTKQAAACSRAVDGD